MAQAPAPSFPLPSSLSSPPFGYSSFRSPHLQTTGEPLPPFRISFASGLTQSRLHDSRHRKTRSIPGHFYYSLYLSPQQQKVRHLPATYSDVLPILSDYFPNFPHFLQLFFRFLCRTSVTSLLFSSFSQRLLLQTITVNTAFASGITASPTEQLICKETLPCKTCCASVPTPIKCSEAAGKDTISSLTAAGWYVPSA